MKNKEKNTELDYVTLTDNSVTKEEGQIMIIHVPVIAVARIS